uniref:Uncharacterized protein n=1 Tax=Anguilla anguilla TaxID=7936 RepID=A0A0E9SSV2_ANGAN
MNILKVYMCSWSSNVLRFSRIFVSCFFSPVVLLQLIILGGGTD